MIIPNIGRKKYRNGIFSISKIYFDSFWKKCTALFKVTAPKLANTPTIALEIKIKVFLSVLLKRR
jgi:hypothetical protein